MSSVPAIELLGVSKSFGKRRCLDGLSLEVQVGEVFGLLGPNGAGKTTTLRALLGLVRPDAGSIRLLGLDPVDSGREVRRSVGVLLEADGLYDRLTALDNLDFHARIHGINPKARQVRLQTLLESFGLWDRRHDMVAEWSRGMRVRLALARSMLHAPRVLLLDEPFAGLDPAAAVVLRQLLVDVARADETTVLITSHDLAHVERSCERVAMIVSGKTVAVGPPGQLSTMGANVTVEVVGEGLSGELLESMQSRRVIQSFVLGTGRAEIVCARSMRASLAGELIGGGARIEEVRTVQQSLEDAFLSVLQSVSEPKHE